MSEQKEEILIGSIEAGGTKMICAVGTPEGKIKKEERFPTAIPEETVPKMLAFFKSYPIQSLGIATFGPVILDKKSENYGCLTTKIKPGWQMFNYLEAFKELNVPIKIDTDCNGSCLGELTYGVAKGLSNVVYITVGTGVGIGVCVEGSMVHGILHPEGGHIPISRRQGDNVKSTCPYHENCLEGLAAGPSLNERYHMTHEEMANKEEIWDLEAEYLAQACWAYICIVCPQKIIIGGGVGSHKGLIKLIREKLKEKNNGYYQCDAMEDLDNLIVGESLEGKQGILGGIKLGVDALIETKAK